ncbi:MAG: hypothetical protein QHH75_09795 [Bacillota bacterium]|nr:hypothetical protein [Bacillota bacterium]
MLGKKLLAAATVFLFLFLVAAGCSSKTDSAGNTGAKDSASVTASGENIKQPAPPGRPPEMIGKVKTIAGNKLTVYEVRTPSRPSGPPESGPPERSEIQQRQGEPPPSPEERAERRAEMFQVTDKTFDLVISADAQIIKIQDFNRNSENQETARLEVGDIQEGDLLMLWFGEKLSSGEQSVTFIQLIWPD